jgi:hypothetical protein
LKKIGNGYLHHTHTKTSLSSFPSSRVEAYQHVQSINNTDDKEKHRNGRILCVLVRKCYTLCNPPRQILWVYSLTQS